MPSHLSNGKVSFEEPRMTPLAVPFAIRMFSIAYVQFATIALIVIAMSVQIFVVLPTLRDISVTIHATRDAEIRHAKLIEDARKRQVTMEATLLLNQKENLRISEEISKLLKEHR